MPVTLLALTPRLVAVIQVFHMLPVRILREAPAVEKESQLALLPRRRCLVDLRALVAMGSRQARAAGVPPDPWHQVCFFCSSYSVLHTPGIMLPHRRVLEQPVHMVLAMHGPAHATSTAQTT